MLDGGMRFLRSMWIMLRQNKKYKTLPKRHESLDEQLGKMLIEIFQDSEGCVLLRHDAV